VKHKLLALSRRYLAALRKHLQQGAASRPPTIHRLGEEAVALGLETLDLARIHEKTLATVILPSYSCRTRTRMTRRAEMFFAEANMAIEKTHFAAVEAAVQWQQLNEMLGQRTEELAVSRRGLKRGIVHRKAAQEDFKKREKHSARLLEQSRKLQEHLRRLTRQIFATQEDERKKMSRELHDEIAQTLLGINVRLITLKRDAAAGTADIHEYIMDTERVVEKSIKTMLRLAHEFTKIKSPRGRIDKPVKTSVN
jgi:signal transduction histidine kinase